LLEVSAFGQVAGKFGGFLLKRNGLLCVAVEFEQVGAYGSLALADEKVVGQGIEQREAAAGTVRHRDGDRQPQRCPAHQLIMYAGRVRALLRAHGRRASGTEPPEWAKQPLPDVTTWAADRPQFGDVTGGVTGK